MAAQYCWLAGLADEWQAASSTVGLPVGVVVGDVAGIVVAVVDVIPLTVRVVDPAEHPAAVAAVSARPNTKVGCTT
jgi:hypothetical protein